jgi:CRISPR-associated protein Cas1
LSKVLREPYKFSGRSFRPAKDPFNAFLNYAYGVLYGRVEKALILAGVDPYVGFLHRDDYNFKSMVYDFIEPYRVFADKVVFSLFSGKKVNQSHTDQIANGFQLNKEGKVLLIEQLNKYLEQEKVRYRGRNQTRSNIIQADAHQFAHDLIA